MNPEIKLALLRTLPFWIVIVVVAVLLKKKKLNKVNLDLRQPKSFKLYASWIIGFAGLVILEEIILHYFSLLEVKEWTHSFVPSVFLIAGAVIAAPIAEELLFRGLILNILKKKKISIHLAVVIQAIFFVVLHNFTFENTLSSNIGIVQSFTDGMFFAYARICTRSLFTSMTMHVLGNAVAILERFIL